MKSDKISNSHLLRLCHNLEKINKEAALASRPHPESDWKLLIGFELWKTTELLLIKSTRLPYLQ